MCCNPSWARPPARADSVWPLLLSLMAVWSDLQARRALGRDLVKLLHCSLDVSRLRLGHTLEALKALLPEFLRETSELLWVLGLAHLEGFFDGPDSRLVLSVKRLMVLVQHIGDRLAPFLLGVTQLLEPGGSRHCGSRGRTSHGGKPERLCPEHLRQHLRPLHRPVPQHVLLQFHRRLGGLAVVFENHVKHCSPPYPDSSEALREAKSACHHHGPQPCGTDS